MLEELIRSLAPLDLPPELPFYPVLASHGVPNELIPAGVIGITGPRLDLALKAYLEQRGQWRGRGPAFVIDNYNAEDYARDISTDMESQFAALESTCISAAIHEAAHILATDPDLSEGPPPDAVFRFISVLASFENRDEVFSTPPWSVHRAPFIRALCHLMARAEAAGHDLIDEIAFCHENYRLSPITEYRSTLTREIEAWAERSFSELRTTRPPKSFIDLWQCDLRAWFRDEQPDERGTAVFSEAHGMFDLDTESAPTIEAAAELPTVVGILADDPVQIGDEITAQGAMILGASPLVKTGPAKFRTVAYSGGSLPHIELSAGIPTVIDLAGLTRTRNITAWLDGSRIGHVTTKITTASACYSKD